MISLENCQIIASVTFYVLIKIYCYYSRILQHNMYEKHRQLSSIPEMDTEEESPKRKWVPKKKHEVLKAKYKCLKKLFQIYDASVIGVLPDNYGGNGDTVYEEPRRRERRPIKADAAAGTTDISSVDTEIDRCSSVATAVMRDLKLTQCSLTSTQIVEAKKVCKEDVATQNSKDNVSVSTASEKECDCIVNARKPIPEPNPYINYNYRSRKPTRFQIFIQRLLGIRQERPIKGFYASQHHYSLSDGHIYQERRRRRGLRFRRLGRAKRVHSDSCIRDAKSPFILTYVQSVQRNCLMDTTPRQCPILGCKMIYYGIINYNDHLNLCHFTERKFICHYCHEGFEREQDKFIHENEHLGISKLNTNIRYSNGPHSIDTQTDPDRAVPEEKLKKIVSFFDKIVDADHMISDVSENRHSETNLQRVYTTDNDISSDSCYDKRTQSCGNVCRKIFEKPCTIQSDSTSKTMMPFKCHLCGETFGFRRQLSLHVDLEHRAHDKFSKFHSCPGMNGHHKVCKYGGVDSSPSEPSESYSTSTYSPMYSLTRRKSDESVSCDRSTNIVYYTSLESVKKSSKLNNIVQKVKSGLVNYKWESGTKIIHV